MSPEPHDRAGLSGYWDGVLLFANIVGLLLAGRHYVYGQRFPCVVYAGFVVVQVATIGVHFGKRNVLTAIFGLGQTAVLGIALLIESAGSINFDPIYTSTVYTPELIARAYSVLLLCTSFYYVVATCIAPKSVWLWRDPDRAEVSFARLTTRIALPSGIVLLIMTSSGTDIRQTAYGSSDSLRSPVLESSGLLLIALFLLAFALVSACRSSGLKSTHFKFVSAVVLACTGTCLTLHGDRGGTLVILTTLGLVFWFSSTRRPISKGLIVLAYGLCIFEFYEIWAFVRWNAATMGIYGAFREYVKQPFVMNADGTFNPLFIALLPQSYWQLLHSIDLKNSGYALGLSRFLDLIPQSIPQFICDYFGYERPINGAWLLSEYRVSSGGFFLTAEGYWNAGLLGAGLTTTALAAIASLLDRWFRRQSPVLSMTYLPIAGCFGFTLFYGMQPFVKAFEVAFCMAVALKWAYEAHERRCKRKKRRPERYAPATCRGVAL